MVNNMREKIGAEGRKNIRAMNVSDREEDASPLGSPISQAGSELTSPVIPTRHKGEDMEEEETDYTMLLFQKQQQRREKQ